MDERALLLTDVVDSTRLSEQLGDRRMAEVWTEHDRVARDLLVAHGGLEIDKTDGFLLMFDEVPAAVAYALDYHRALAGLSTPLQARAGLHLGPVLLRHNPPADVARGAKPIEVEGMAKPTAARVMGVAQGGQTLLTPSAMAALGPSELRAVCHGHWRMKGVADPVELFEVGADDAPFTPPPDGAKVYRVVRQGEVWLPVREVPHTLPAERDVFVGRRADLLALAAAIDDGGRLVSLLGIGGTGKTRLVIRYGWSWLGDWPGGVWFCDLSESRSVDGIVSALARVLSVPLKGGDAVEQLGHAIAGRGPCLMVLDNFEQVAAWAPDTLGRWLDLAPSARFVVTTREVLGLPGEVVLSLAPLAPEAAEALFVARAAIAQRGFEVRDEERAALVQLVALLDHLPLAIELAAARVRMMSIETLLARMGDRFRLLASRGGRADRQATLRATLDWSWDLLTPPERAALAQLSVFEGGWTVGTAEAVLELGAFDDPPWAVDVLQSLVDRSLVRLASHERFDLLVSVQEYASAHLEAMGGADAAARQHGRHFATLGAVRAVGSAGGPALQRLREDDLDNLVVACRRALARRDGDVAAQTALAAWTVFKLSGPAGVVGPLLESAMALPGVAVETAVRLRQSAALDHLAAGRLEPARAHLDAARDLGPLSRSVQAGLLDGFATLERIAGEIRASQHHSEAAVAIARELDEPHRLAAFLVNQALSSRYLGRPEAAEEQLAEALALGLGDPGLVAHALGAKAALLQEQGRLQASTDAWAAALDEHRGVGHRARVAEALGNLGATTMQLGRFDEADGYLSEALSDAEWLGDTGFQGWIRHTSGMLAIRTGRLREARAHLEAAVTLAQDSGERRSAAWVGATLAGLMCQLGEPGALAMLDEPMAFARTQGDRRLEAIVWFHSAVVHASEHRMADARQCLDHSVGIAVEIGDISTEGVAQALRGELCLDHGPTDAARDPLERALGLAREMGDRDQEAAVLAQLARFHAAAGRGEQAREAIEHAQRIVAGGTGATRAMLLVALAQAWWGLGDVRRAAALLDEGSAVAPAGDVLLARKEADLRQCFASVP